jgi:hypothetical protein
VKTRLEKAEEDLKKAKADLKAREMQARSRKERLAKYITAEEELKVKIETAKENLRVKEESVAARRARKNAKRDAFLRGTYEQREAKRQENMRIKTEVHEAEMSVETTSTSVAEESVVKERDFDIDFDIDIYIDE